jgi:hypothetical protein
MLVGPVVGGLGAWFGVRASLASAESERERALIRRYTGQMIALVVGFLVVLGLATPFEAHIWRQHPQAAAALGAFLPILYGIALAISIMRFNRAISRVRAEEAPRRDPAAANRQAALWRTVEYKSRWTLLGLPLVHIRLGRLRGEKLRPAVGWIAIGDAAIGVIFSLGGLAAGGLSIGGVSVGLFALGGVSLGVLAIAGIAIGLYGASGGLALGYLAHGAWALAWHAAEGGMAVAREFACGQSATALHANDSAARGVISSHPFFHAADTLLHRYPLAFSIAWLPLLLPVWQSFRTRRLKNESGISNS